MKSLQSNKAHRISLTPELHRQIEEIVTHSGQFTSVADFVNTVLNDLLFPESRPDNSRYDKAIQQRLQDLGYL